MSSSKRTIVPLPYWVYRLEMLLFCLGGLYVSSHLTYTHYANYNIISYQSFCALSQHINCDHVAQSHYSILLGVPVAVWGLLGYLAMLAIIGSGFARRFGTHRFWPLCFFISILYSFISIIYAYISVWHIESICILCYLTYGTNFSFVLISWITIRRYRLGYFSGLREDVRIIIDNIRLALPIGLVFAFSAIALIAYYPPYWNFYYLPDPSNFHQGVTSDGYPWIGAKSPRLTVVEFADYQCFPCKKSHLAIRKLIQKYPDKLRLVHRHYPMGKICNPIVQEIFHENSCILALLAICAERYGRFWEMNDYLFYNHMVSEEQINIKALTSSMKINYPDFADCLNQNEALEQMKEDILEGNRLNITATPSYLIDGKIYDGAALYEKISEYIDTSSDTPEMRTKNGS